MQSAAITAHTTPVSVVKDASASGSVPGATVAASTASVPCTCFSQTGADGRRRPSLARALSLFASPISRVVTNARTPGGAGQSGARISGRSGIAK